MFEDYKRFKHLFSYLLPVFLSSLLLIFSFPKLNQGYLAWIALVPLLLISYQRKPLLAFYLGGITGLITNLGIFYWIINAVVVFGGLPIVVGILILTLLVAYLALYTGVFCFLISYLVRDSARLRWLLPPMLWTTLELIRAHFMTGFPWASLGYSQYLYLQVIQIAEFTGIYGVTFLIVLVNSTIAMFINDLQKIEGKQACKAIFSKMSLIVLLLFVSNMFFGWIRSEQIETRLEGSSSFFDVSLIQGNISQDRKWDRAFSREIIESYLELTGQALMTKPDLVIWPESASPFFFLREKASTEEVLDFVSERKFFLLFGGDYLEGESGNYRIYNSAFLLSPGGQVLGRYDKNHLVPFGEYVPLRKLLFFINKMVVGDLDYSRGKELKILNIPQGSFGVQICYEIIFPELTRALAREGIKFIAVITNDAWFGATSAPYQHFSMVVFRAIETRLPVVRAANTGISGVIDQTGKIVAASPIFVKAEISNRIKLLNQKETFYTRFGDVFALGVALSTVIILIQQFIYIRKQ